MKYLSIIIFFVFIHSLYAVNPIPGWEYMFAGYDIRNASSKSVVNGIKYPLFVPTYDLGQTYSVPNSTVVYDVPDQFYAYPIYETVVQTSTDIFESLTEMLTEETSSFSFGIGFNIDGFGISANYKQASGFVHEIFNQTERAGAKGHLDSFTTKFVMGPYPLFTISPFFTELMDKIPTCPSSPDDIANVKMMNQVWGQVFPTQLFLGGRFDCVSSIDESLLQKYDSSWVMTQLSLKFTYDGFDLYAGGFVNRSNIEISKVFEEASETDLFFIGGDPALQSNNTEKEWFESIPEYPGLISATFSPITALLSDTLKAANINYMLTNYINTGNWTAPPCANEYTFETPSGVQNLSPIPGSSFVGAGYDTLTMQIKGHVIQNTYSPGSVWTNPFYPEYSYAVADTLYVDDSTNNFEVNFTSIAMSDSEFMVQLQNQASGSSGFLNFGKYANSMYVYQFYHDLHQYDQSLNTRTLTWFDLELNPLVEAFPLNYLTPWAKDIFLNLGTNISDPTVYQQYWNAIQFYGNSLVRQASIGGSFNFQAFLQDNVVQEITVEKFSQQSSFSFLGLFSTSSAWNFYAKSVSDEVKENTVCTIMVIGGEWDPKAYPFLKETATGAYSFSLAEVKEPILSWQIFVDSIKENMQPTYYEIVPLYTIFSDSVISNNFRIVSEEYVQNVHRFN